MEQTDGKMNQNSNNQNMVNQMDAMTSNQENHDDVEQSEVTLSHLADIESQIVTTPSVNQLHVTQATTAEPSLLRTSANSEELDVQQNDSLRSVSGESEYFSETDFSHFSGTESMVSDDIVEIETVPMESLGIEPMDGQPTRRQRKKFHPMVNLINKNKSKKRARFPANDGEPIVLPPSKKSKTEPLVSKPAKKAVKPAKKAVKPAKKAVKPAKKAVKQPAEPTRRSARIAGKAFDEMTKELLQMIKNVTAILNQQTAKKEDGKVPTGQSKQAPKRRAPPKKPNRRVEIKKAPGQSRQPAKGRKPRKTVKRTARN